jgi:shikimate O-hydroxycinnamoyltransferase
MEVEILSRKLIAPSSPRPLHLQKSPISLSFSEQLAPSFYVPRIFFYPAEADQEHGHVDINEARSMQLQKSFPE